MVQKANQAIPLQQFSISLEDFQCTVKQIKNCFDEIHCFWLKKLTAIHLPLTELYKKAIYEPPTWLVQGITHLFIKSHSKCESAYDVSNYRPNTCLSNSYLEISNKNCWELNLFTFNAHSLFPPDQKGNRCEIWGISSIFLLTRWR